jgi:hypothetical protein
MSKVKWSMNKAGWWNSRIGIIIHDKSAWKCYIGYTDHDREPDKTKPTLKEAKEWLEINAK